MPDADLEWIAKRAYALWEEEGRPDGRHHAHWQAASEEWKLLQQAATATSAKAGQRIARAKSVSANNSRLKRETENYEVASGENPAPAHKGQPRGQKR